MRPSLTSIPRSWFVGASERLTSILGFIARAKRRRGIIESNYKDISRRNEQSQLEAERSQRLFPQSKHRLTTTIQLSARAALSAGTRANICIQVCIC